MPSLKRTLICLAFATLSASEIGAAQTPTYNSDIRQILSNNCFRCHGPDEDARKAKMRLDVPGDVDWDEVIARIGSADPDEIMPPPESNKSLTVQQKRTLRIWIAGGAKYEQHWAFAAPKKSPVPPGKNAIDHLEPAKSPQADKLTLARRVHLDLIGLPPTPEEADAFANDPSPDAYEKLVDRLLASPRYGERWARRWLDLARYADTNGYEKDRDRSIWPYRDWVIRAVNADMPFDQFTIEQLAGDMLPEATPQQRTATGFHRNTMLNEEGGIDPLEFRFHSMTDRVATTGTTWLGLTTGCAQCHTHKYDPITHTDYFGMMAYLNNADEPDYIIPDPGAQTKADINEAKSNQLLAALPDKWPRFSDLPLKFSPIAPEKVITASESVAKINSKDASVQLTGDAPDKDTYTVVLISNVADLAALKLEVLTFAKGKGPGRTEHGNFVLSEIEITAAPLDGSAAPEKVAISSATADVEQPGFGVASAIDGDPNSNGWGIHDPNQPLNANRSATFRFSKPIRHPSGTRLTIKLSQNLGGGHTIGRFRISLAPVSRAQSGKIRTPQQLASAAFKKWLTSERAQVVDWHQLIPDQASANFPYLVHEGDGVIFAGGDTSKHDIYKIKFAAQEKPITSLRLEALPDERLPDRGPGTTFYEGRKGDFYLTEFNIAGSKIASATETYAKNRFGSNPVSARLATDGDIQTGWSVSGRIGERHVAVFVLEKPIPAGQAVELEMHFGRHYASSLGKFRVSTHSSATVASERNQEVDRLLAKKSLTEQDREHLYEAFLMQVEPLKPHADHIRELRKPPGGTTTLVLQERPASHPRTTRRHHRGEYLAAKEVVTPRLPEAIFPEGQEQPKNRLEFARWLVSKQNPLTARVVANRQWAAFFEEGIVRTLDDFGMQGALPKNQRLLDHLAITLRDDLGWSIKKLHRQIVLSAAYRQKDRPRTRLDAEIIRDGSLRAAGVLNDKMFGPPVRPPQPAGVTEVAYGSPKWKPSSGTERFRRSLYTYQKRTAPFAMFTTFDAGSGEACIAKRDRSNTPLQALTLMNDPMFVEIADAFGKHIATTEGDSAQKIHSAFRRVLTRAPSDTELEKLEEFHAKHQDWRALARILLSLDEAITKP